MTTSSSAVHVSPLCVVLCCQDCDTFHALIKEYREQRKVLLNVEHRLMLTMAPTYPLLLLIQKVEVFEYALSRTSGLDLAKILWLHSPTSEQWLERRMNYTHSLAVMSMVGYVLGLGDRHPCNLMLDAHNGKVIHVDFGDCFEVAMTRDKFPERIPFRLTRMLILSMEVSGVEGVYKRVSEGVMRVLRENKESVMAVLEAFVYDPLLGWRLLHQKGGRGGAAGGQSSIDATAINPDVTVHRDPINGEVYVEGMSPPRARDETNLPTPTPSAARPYRPPVVAVGDGVNAIGSEGDEAEEDVGVMNVKALSVIARVEAKLLGKDFEVVAKDGGVAGGAGEVGGSGGASAVGSASGVLDVRTQVERLIVEATSHVNLAQCYVGWCAFW